MLDVKILKGYKLDSWETGTYKLTANEIAYYRLNKNSGILEQWGLVAISGTVSFYTLQKSYKSRFTIIASSSNMSADTNISAQCENEREFSLKKAYPNLNNVGWYTIGFI